MRWKITNNNTHDDTHRGAEEPSKKAAMSSRVASAAVCSRAAAGRAALKMLRRGPLASLLAKFVLTASPAAFPVLLLRLLELLLELL